MFHIACSTGQVDLVRKCINNHMSPLVVDKDGNTPLHISAALDNSECVQALLEINAPIMIRNNNGKTAMEIASAQNKLLLDDYIKQTKDEVHAYYDSVIKNAKRKYSGAGPITQIFVIGNPGAAWEKLFGKNIKERQIS